MAIEPRANGRPLCSGCGQPAPGYDRQRRPRRFDYVPLWGMAVSFLYAMRRVNCPACGIKVEQVPWADGKCHLTTSYRWFLARWAQRLSWKGVADVFHTTWENVFRAVRYAVSWGLAHRDESGIEAHRRGRDPMEPRAQVPDARLSDRRRPQAAVVGGGRTNGRELAGIFPTPHRRRAGRHPLRVQRHVEAVLERRFAKKIGQAVHVLDRFHLMKKMNEAIDQVRREEVPRLKRAGYEQVLKHSRWCLLKPFISTAPRIATSLFPQASRPWT